MSFSIPKPSNAAMRSNAGINNYPVGSASQVLMRSVVVSPVRIEKPTRLRSLSLTGHLGSTSPLSPLPFGTDGTGTHSHPSNASEMVSSPRKNLMLKKPKRPLTAYHIFFQIEREFIIQTMAGEDADKSIHQGKIFFRDVPNRYINIKLSPDWYFGPGKRAKRKHRKQHGKIGFLELSRLITSRWTKLEETDPDIKRFVSKLAKQENEAYKRELKEYRENLTKNMFLPAVFPKSSSSSRSSMKQQSVSQVHRQQHVMTMMPQHQMMDYKQQPQQTSPRTFSSSSPFCGTSRQPIDDRTFMQAPSHSHRDREIDALQNDVEYSNEQKAPLLWGKPQPKDDVDYCISLIDNNTKVSSSEKNACRRDSVTASPSFLDLLIFLGHKIDGQSIYDESATTKKQRVDDFDTRHFVDICDDDIMSMWKSTNSE